MFYNALSDDRNRGQQGSCEGRYSADGEHTNRPSPHYGSSERPDPIPKVINAAHLLKNHLNKIMFRDTVSNSYLYFPRQE